MRLRVRFGLSCLLSTLALAANDPPLGHAQGTQEQYERSRTLAQRTQGKVTQERLRSEWFGPDDRYFWYRLEHPGGHQVMLVDTENGVPRPAFDHLQLARELAERTGASVAAERLDLRGVTFNDAATECRFVAYGQRWAYDLTSATLRPLDGPADLLGGLEPLERLRPSSEAGEPTEVQFVNRLECDVQLHWLDSRGQRRQYGTIPAGDERPQSTYAGHVWLITDEEGEPLAAYAAAPEPAPALIEANLPRPRPQPARRRGGAPRDRSPDGQWAVIFRDHNVVLRNIHWREEDELTSDGNEENEYRGPVWWSPDSQRFVVMRTQPGEARTIPLIDSSPGDQLQPRLLEVPYAKPGDRLDHPRPQLFDVESRSQIAIDDALFSNPYALTSVSWRDDSRAFRFLYNQRGHQVLRVIEVDAETGAPRALVDESSETFIDYAHKQFLRFLDETDELIWMSERDGWNHLYLIDQTTTEVLHPITSGPWVVRGVERVDPDERQIWLQVGGIHPDQDPYHLHLARVNFDGSEFTVLTDADGTHRWEFSPQGRFLVATWSRVDQPPVHELRAVEDGRKLSELARADASELLAAGWTMPQPFVAAGRDGETDIYGVIVRPSDFDPAREYPVLELIYAGPHAAHVPKRFGRHLRYQEMAELGFIVVQIDGMGTSYRSKAFHDKSWKNLADAGFPDRIAWLKAAAEQHPEMDLQRVGIWGGSAGGQNALAALLAHGDFYKAAVADCGCHDNRMDKIWWNELWMGWPIEDHYEEQSNVTRAHQLQGDLLLIVGELDRNVDPASTMQVVDALIAADKDFDLLVVPGGGHGVGSAPYGKRRTQDFFVRKLWKTEPRN